jgi:hypothetical protein
MKDTFKNELNISDSVIFMIQHYDGRWDSFHKGTIVGFTPCFVKIKPEEDDNHWDFFQYVEIGKEYCKMRKPYILRQSHKIIKI